MPALNEKKKIVCMHLRSGSYKNNEANAGMGIRSVDPLTYQKMATYLKNSGYRVINITADKIQ